MFRRLIRRFFERDPAWRTAAQPPGEVFPFPKGTKLQALEEVVLAFPAAILEADQTFGSVIQSDDDAQFAMPEGDDRFYLRLEPGMSLTLTKSCQGVVVAEDKRPRRFKVHFPPKETR